MSFAADVKKEIIDIVVDECCLKAELYAIIKLKATIAISKNKFKIILTTTSNSTARRIIFLFKKLYNHDLKILVKDQNKLDYKKIYTIDIENSNYILEDLNILDINKYISDDITTDIFKNECCKIAFLRGVFLSCGSINNPMKKFYHLEIVCKKQEEAKLIIKILSEMDIIPQLVERTKGIVVYIKKAEAIGDFLKYIGANKMLFSFEDARIKKDLNNYVNRIMNCDVANEQKAIASALKQMEDMKIITENIPQSKIDPRLYEVIYLRNNNPDDSLSQLSEKSYDELGYYISKSGLSHRFKEIRILADRYRKK